MASFRLCYVIFFLSGAAGLVYEMSWSRQMGLLLGHTVHAAAAVLAAYFAGMAIGYLLGARWSSRISPLLGYGVAELVVAVWACLIPSLVEWSETPEIAKWWSDSSIAWQATRAAFCFVLLLPATTALGATLPLMAEFLARPRGQDVGDTKQAARVTLAYAWNTAGALAGVLSATFFLLLVIGVRGSSYVAASISVACAVAAFLVGTRERRADDWQAGDRPFMPPDSPSARLRAQLPWLVLAALSGFGTLALEVLYTRMFSLVFHNSTYTFGAVVAVFLASLSLGAGLASRLPTSYHAVRLAGWVASFGAMATVFSVHVFAVLTDLDYYSYGESFSQYLLGAVALVAWVIAPPITLLGMLLPLVWKATGNGDLSGGIVGRLTAANTAAAACGALAASFLLLPVMGLWQAFAFSAALFLVIGVALLMRSGNPAWAYGAMVAFVGLVLLALRSPIEPSSLRSSSGEQLVQRWNSPYGWIDLVRTSDGESFKIRQNLHYRFGTTGDNAREYRQAHIPLLLHERPRDVLFLGLGTGLTASGAIPHREVKHVVVVELIAEVVQAARMLAEQNHGVVDHPKVSVRVDDARYYLLATDQRFDVIVSDLFVPWESETGYLYTAEHYRVARRRMKPDGLFCQWLPLYQLGAREFELIADTFASEFPVTTIWWGEMDSARPVIALVGSQAPLEIDRNRLAERLAALGRASESSEQDVQTDLQTVEQFLLNYQGDWTPRNPSHLNTDEHPRVEFLTPISNRDHQMLTGRGLQAYFDAVLSQLPSQATTLHSASESTPATVRQHHAWQRLIMFGSSPP